MRNSLKNLDLGNKESLVNLLLEVQAGYVSCRRAATEIQSKLPKKGLTLKQRTQLRRLRAGGRRVDYLADRFNINKSTVWRICRKEKP